MEMRMPPGGLRVAAVQAEPVWFDLAATVDLTIHLIERAASKEAKLVVFPELWLPGYPFHAWFDHDPNTFDIMNRLRSESLTLGHAAHKRIENAAATGNIHVVVGFSERCNDEFYIAQMLIGRDGRTLMTRRKLRPTGPESRIFGSGNAEEDLKVVPTELGNLGALNCNEHRRPLLRHTLMAQGEEIHVASWPSHALMPNSIPMSAATSLRFSRQYAIEGGVYVLAPTMVVGAKFWARVPIADSNRHLLENGHGATRIIDPDGQNVCEPMGPADEGLLLADLESSRLYRTFEADPLNETNNVPLGHK
ncbi:carbon-nitrogen hydrolase family protein [Arthrobacter sulfonylureivorans]|uniref:Carbon-nitrogen hydrolase family protein n=1 Tax=Arthrobacter sulfonylureivorans TaxID=2486855 RepID=A0ABY3WFI9_9MICC|nr:carbon-nitrogen hydrolase family protein [Arthrobacter sulfonylureivorans]UNK47102.1 carbon-nitrogen hydrolase family protein [Arthrobacter sulfonylureivorans]